MFTGIIEEIGTIKRITTTGQSSKLLIGAGKILEGIRQGDSINTDGVCLTVAEIRPDSFSADVMPETMRRTAFSELTAGSRVNLERALRLSDRLGGHLVSGHIDGTGIIRRKWTEDNAIWLSISSDKNILKYIAEKGSVAIDGISLTVTSLEVTAFSVSLIPHTQSVTTLSGKKEGMKVNIECDMIAKYVERLAGNSGDGSKLSLDFLAQQGFI